MVEPTPSIENMPALALAHVIDNVLCIPDESDARSAFTSFWIHSIDDLMNVNVTEDLCGEYTHSARDTFGETAEYTHKLPPMLIRNIILLQEWSLEQPIDEIGVWFRLTKSSFSAWKSRRLHANNLVTATTMAPAQVTPNVSPTTTSDPANFQRSIKRSPNDYNKFKDDTRWKQWHRHIRATANSHGLTDVFDPSYVPASQDAEALFHLQNTFMYSVFEQCLNTAKSRHIVQTYDSSANAQLVYAGLLSAYEEDLTTSLAATDLRSELTLLRFDDQWKKSSEAFLQHWQAKILELEQLEDKAVDDSTKRLWLTATLSTKSHMAACLTQARVTEMTLLAMGNTTAQHMPWENFYNLVVSHAKLYDHSKPTKIRRESNLNERGRGRVDGRGRGRGRGTHGRGSTNRVPNPDLVWTIVSGPNMTMAANMKFKTEEYQKLSAAQKLQLRIAKGYGPYPVNASPSPRTVNNMDVQAITPVVTESPAPNVPIQADSHLRQTLSNRSVRTDTATNNNVEQVGYNGHTNQRITNMVKAQYHINDAQRITQQGSLIDGGANGGMSGDDVTIIEHTLNHADVSGLADHSVIDLPIVTVAGVLESSQENIIGIFHQYAHLGTGKTVHSANQMRHFGIDICDIPRSLNGKQQIYHPDGYVIPIAI